MSKLEIIETQGSQPAPEPQKPVAEKKPEEPRYVRLEDLEKVNQAINNTREYNNRQLQEINAKIEKALSAIPKPISTGEPELDELVQTDWKGAVQKISQRVISEYEKTKQVEAESQKTARILEESKTRVLERHKELSDPESPKTKEFLKVLAENPDFTTNPRGPLLAMHEMENRLNLHGKVELGDTKVRETRSRATGIPAGSPSSQKGYVMTKADMDFCRLNGINPENYKRLKGQREASV